MPVIQKCTFCGSSIAPGTGKLFIRKDAKMLWLCGNKCEKNLHKLKRKPRETRWTAEFKVDKKARMAAIAHEAAQTPAEKASTKEKPVAKKKSK